MSEIDERGLEAFCEQYFCWWRLPDTTDEMREAQRVHIRPALLAYEQHRGKQEPVAWRLNYDVIGGEQGHLIFFDRHSAYEEAVDLGGTVTPLYASPRPADVGALRDEDHIEAVVKIVERRGGRGHKNTVALLRALTTSGDHK